MNTLKREFVHHNFVASFYEVLRKFPACTDALDMERKVSQGLVEERDSLSAQLQQLEASLREKEGW